MSKTKPFSTKASLALWRRRLTYRGKRLAAARRAKNRNRIASWTKRVSEARANVRNRERQLGMDDLGAQAWAEAGRLVGVVEKGGNNSGPEVEAIIRDGGGNAKGRPAWCGYFVGHCYKHAGSKSITWQIGAVRLIRSIAGIRVTPDPHLGDVVTYTFDHTGLFGYWCDSSGRQTERRNASHIRAREGNTGSSGAVSDSGSGKDGVKEKIRHRSLINEFLEVTR